MFSGIEGATNRWSGFPAGIKEGKKKRIEATWIIIQIIFHKRPQGS